MKTLGLYRAAMEALESEKNEVFPLYSAVIYGATQCIIVRSDGWPPHKLPLLFENGNVWWKDIHCCIPVRDRKLESAWIKKWRRKRRSIK